MGYTRDCEPLRVWNRLEPRARKPDFAETLRAEIHDPLWLLARQWQFGEFAGEDTGSPIFARMAMRTRPLVALQDGAAHAVPLVHALPLEANVEREPLPRDITRQATVGRQWLKILKREGDAYNAMHPTGTTFIHATYRALFLGRFAIAAPTLSAELDRARHDSNSTLLTYEAALAGRALDGRAVLDAIGTGDLLWSTLPARITAGVPLEHRDVVVSSLQQLRAWATQVWLDPPAADQMWDPSQLEYRFSCEIPSPDGARVALRASEYATGHLDWYSFDLGAGGPSQPTDATTVEVATVIPTLAEFPGQPHPRFWQIEDGAVDLGNIRVDSTDLARVLVSQYALVYGNNWFIAPVTQPIGSLAEILGIVVTDVFGERSLVRPANTTSSSWARWDMFSLDREADANVDVGEHLFLAPAVLATNEGEVIESVRFVRDEMANLVWGIETRIGDEAGGGRDGHEAARAFLDRQRRADAAPAPPTAITPGISFRLGNTVPENWIPFLPVHTGQDDRAIRLQRASMPRMFRDTVMPVRPRTRILRAGLTEADEQAMPYYLHEEEVPRAGVQVDVTMQRARWIDGTTAVWCGRRARTGRGQGGSGLRFDVIEPVR
jgi:hypothetical protein